MLYGRLTASVGMLLAVSIGSVLASRDSTKGNDGSLLAVDETGGTADQCQDLIDQAFMASSSMEELLGNSAFMQELFVALTTNGKFTEKYGEFMENYLKDASVNGETSLEAQQNAATKAFITKGHFTPLLQDSDFMAWLRPKLNEMSEFKKKNQEFMCTAEFKTIMESDPCKGSPCTECNAACVAPSSDDHDAGAALGRPETDEGNDGSRLAVDEPGGTAGINQCQDRIDKAFMESPSMKELLGNSAFMEELFKALRTNAIFMEKYEDFMKNPNVTSLKDKISLDEAPNALIAAFFDEGYFNLLVQDSGFMAWLRPKLFEMSEFKKKNQEFMCTEEFKIIMESAPCKGSPCTECNEACSAPSSDDQAPGQSDDLASSSNATGTED